MTAKSFELNAELRLDQGKGASRRLRRTQDKIPAILYGGDEDPISIMLDHKKLMHALENDAFYSHILTLNIEGKKQKAVLKDLQRHHYKKAIFHADFLRISAKHPITMHVPLHFIGEAENQAIINGAIISHRLNSLEIRCLPGDLPESISVDVSNLKLDESIHLTQLKIPKGVELLALAHGQDPDHDHAVVSIHLPRTEIEPEVVVEETVETEVLPKGKEATGTTPTAKAESSETAPDESAHHDKEKSKGK